MGVQPLSRAGGGGETQGGPSARALASPSVVAGGAVSSGHSKPSRNKRKEKGVQGKKDDR